MRESKGRSASRRPRRPRKWITDDYGNIFLYKQCAVCKGWKVADEGFYTDHQYGTCIVCKRAQHKIWREAHSEERKQYQRAWYQQMKDDPYWKAQQNRNRERYPVDPVKKAEWDRAYRAKIYADPERHADWLAKHRIANGLKRDRQGLPMFPAKGTHNLLYPEREVNHVLLLPIGPISDWLRERMIQLGSLEAISAETGVLGRRITAYKNRHYNHAELEIVEKLLAPSGTLIEDLYPDIDRLIAA